MKHIKIFVFAAVLLLGMAVMTPGLPVLADSPASQMKDGLTKIGATDGATFQDTIQTIINIFLFIIGAVSVLMIIYGGFKYVTSAGESSAVTSAKNTILYAVVGLVVAMLAFAIANFVVGIFDQKSPASSLGGSSTDAAVDAGDSAVKKAAPQGTK